MLIIEKKKNEERKSEDNHVIVGQFKFGISSIELPSIEGLNIYKIKCSRKGVRLVHRSFNPDGCTWSSPPSRNQQQYINLYEGNNTIKLSIEEHFGERDKITVVNSSFRNSVDLNYNVNNNFQIEKSI